MFFFLINEKFNQCQNKFTLGWSKDVVNKRALFCWFTVKLITDIIQDGATIQRNTDCVKFRVSTVSKVLKLNNR